MGIESRWCGEIYAHDAHAWTDPFRRLMYDCDGTGLPKYVQQHLEAEDDDPAGVWADHGDYVTDVKDIAEFDPGYQTSEAERAWRQMGELGE